MVGWYRIIRPVGGLGGYHVTQSTQNYIPNSSQRKTNLAVIAIRGMIMVNSDKKIFFPEYADGVRNEAGLKGCGKVKQWGTQYLASVKGYSYDKILNYYYSGSVYSDGNLRFLRYK